MRATIKIESIGNNSPKIIPQRAWVARIRGICKQYGFKREFVKPVVDIRKSNSVGSRGIYYFYFLNDGIYEVKSPISWKYSDRYFCKVLNGKIERLTKEDVVKCQKDY